MRIGIVGGSISGCAACVALLQLGHGVEVFERAVGALEGRGAGIATLPSVLEELRERKIIGERPETLPFERDRYFARLGVDDRLGRTLLRRRAQIFGRVELERFLYLNLRKQVPHEVYHAGRRVVSLEAGEGKRPRLRSRTAQRRTSTSPSSRTLTIPWVAAMFHPKRNRPYRGSVCSGEAGKARPEAAQRWRTRPWRDSFFSPLLQCGSMRWCGILFRHG